MPYASAGVRELWFGASSAAPLPGFGEARPRAGGARPLSVGLLCRSPLARARRWQTQRDPWSRLLAAARRVARHGERRCDHLHDTVSRYDHAAKRLELLLTCPVCETEKVIHSLAYEPRFEPSVASVHALHPREGAAVDALDRAA
jgi:ribosomal protein L44E